MTSKTKRNRILRYTVTILIPVVLLTCVFFLLTSNSMVKLTTQNMLLQSRDNAELVDAYMYEVVGDMEDIRELIERNCTTDEEVAEFVSSTGNYGVFGGVYTGDNTGFYIGSTPWDIPDDYDPTSRPWYIDGMNSRDFVFGEPYMDASVGIMCVSVSALMDAGDDSIVRVVASDIYLDYMDTIVQDMISTTGIEGALIVTSGGDAIVADSSGEYAGQSMSESSEINSVLASEVIGKSAGIYQISTSSGRYYVTVEEIPVTGWYLITYESRNVILHNLHVVEMIMIIAAALVTVILIVVMLRYGREVSEVEQQANKAKTEFISRISHDIRTPIGQVLNLTEFAKEDKNNPEKLDEDLDRIDSSGRFLLSLINDVLDVSQIESGLMELHPTVMSYTVFINDIKNIMEPLCESKKIKFVFDDSKQDSDLPDILCDEVRIKQITLNLLSNAVKYTPEGGTVTYISENRVKSDGNIAFGYTIKDTGVGMTPEYMEHMYEMFTRDTDNKLRDNTQVGSGLGLYLVKNMVDLMGGTIDYQSEQGKGTTVAVRMDFERAPESAVKETKSAPDTSDTSKTYKGKILLVEDNDLNTEIAMRILEVLGLDVDHAANGREAVDMVAQSDAGYYQLIFMDIQMPVLDGYGATKEIRELGREDAANVPIVAMTADAFKDAVEHSKESGMNDFITKPLVIDKITEILDKYHLN